MNRKIEVGCLVMVCRAIFPENIGKCGTVIGKENYFGDVVWKVEFPSKIKVEIHIANIPTGEIGYDRKVCAPNESLMRIDDPGLAREASVEENQTIEETADV